MSNALHLDVPAGVPWIDFTREFDAPVAALFAAHTDADLVRRWLGPHGYEMEVPLWDCVQGGAYRYVHRDPKGHEYAFRGTFHTVRQDELVVQTFEFEGMPDQVALEFLGFEDLGDGRSRLAGRSLGRTVEGRDEMVAGGMESGMTDGYVKLDALLAERR